MATEAVPSNAGTAGAPAAAPAPAAAATPAAPGSFLADPTPTPEQGATGAQAPTQDGPKQGESAKAEGEKPKADVELKLPEGLQVDEAALGKLKAMVADGKLNAEGAQELINLQAEASKAAEAAKGQQFTAWLEQTKADKELGGANLKASHVLAQKALTAYGNDALREVLRQSGLGNHPEVVRAFVRIGKAMKEDSVDGAGAKPTPTSSQESALRQMYPSMFPPNS